MSPMVPLSPAGFYLGGSDVEGPYKYQPGGYHPVHLGDVFCQRYKVIHKLGFGSYSTVWLARDLQSTVQTRYVALKFVVAELTGKNNEIKIYRHLASRSGTHPGSDRVLTLLDHFKVRGVNGEHDVLVLPVIGPHLEDMLNEEPTVIQQAIKSVAYQVALGTSFLHDCGVVHGDIHTGNIAFEIPGLDGRCERNVLTALGLPHCAPLFVLDRPYQNELLPKYVVGSASLEEHVKLDDLRVKIIDFGDAFFSGEVPRKLHTPFPFRAPEIIFNNLSTLVKIELGTRIDAWSVGCLIYVLATWGPLTGAVLGEAEALRNLTAVLGPLPEEWIDSIGTSYSSSTLDIPFERMLQSRSDIGDTHELFTLLQQIFVFDPLQRPEVSEFMHHPWFTGSSSPATPSGSPSE